MKQVTKDRKEPFTMQRGEITQLNKILKLMSTQDQDIDLLDKKLTLQLFLEPFIKHNELLMNEVLKSHGLENKSEVVNSKSNREIFDQINEKYRETVEISVSDKKKFHFMDLKEELLPCFSKSNGLNGGDLQFAQKYLCKK